MTRAGKSTLAAALVARGARLVADDSLCLRPAAATAAIMASGLPGGYFAFHADLAARLFVAVAPESTLAEAPLGAILLLTRHPQGEPASLCRLAPLPAMTAILRHRHRPAVPALMREAARRLEEAVLIARTPVYRWSRPAGAPSLTAPEWRAIARLSGGSGDG